MAHYFELSTTEQILTKEIKSILVQMAADNELPMDMSELDIGTIAEQAKNNVWPEIKKQQQIENASHYLCETDTHTIEDQINLISENDDPKIHYISQIEGVMVWEPLEYQFSCQEFMDAI